MKIKKTIIEKDEFGKLDLSQNKVWVNLGHEMKEDFSSIVGMCAVEKDDENKCILGSIELLDKDETFTYPDGSSFTTQGYIQAKEVVKMLQNKIQLYPAICGKVLERDENGNITKSELLTVDICTSNIDKTIPPLELEE